jgi:hypothetical protein
MKTRVILSLGMLGALCLLLAPGTAFARPPATNVTVLYMVTSYNTPKIAISGGTGGDGCLGSNTEALFDSTRPNFLQLWQLGLSAKLSGRTITMTFMGCSGPGLNGYPVVESIQLN